MRGLFSVGFTFVLFLSFASCLQGRIETGAEQVAIWQPYLSGKRIGLLVNHTSRVDQKHLVDAMLSMGIDVVRIFAPEHGFRGNADAGELVDHTIDSSTGIPVVSLYGNNKRPSKEQMEGLDVVVFDIQDVGVRFYTYISSMHYMMEACAEHDVGFVVLDRPNPNGDYFDGPVLEPEFSSFVGMHPIPVVHGLTVGELALMINNEGWLRGGAKCEMKVVQMSGYTHSTPYNLPVKPSPNLPNIVSIRLYPSLCLFEATIMSVGRGTLFPFQVVGAPDSVYGDFVFTPRSIEGMAKHPKYENETCYGVDYRDIEARDHKFSLEPLLHFYEKSSYDPEFVSRRRWLNLLIGNDLLLRQMEQGLDEEQIRESWREKLQTYGKLREKYLLYP